ncbi:MAG: hypothetical protein FWG17_07370 [Desulfovibrionaceae bacterium]|nr:hypothetical protein [Desulfovibrionaceae bacterium]
MNKDNLIFIICSYSSMLLGVLCPALGEPLRHLLPFMLMIQLLICFLVTAAPKAPVRNGGKNELAFFLGLKMLITPLLCWGIFALFLPRYALGAILLGGVSIGVTAPFFGQLSRADISFIIAAVVGSCLLLPLTMPVLVVSYLYSIGQEAGAELWKTFFLTGFSLSLYIFLPFILAKGIWKGRPGLAEGILKRRYWIFVLTVACCMFAIFSRYSLPLRDNPMMVLEALGGALLLAALFLILGIASARGKDPTEGVARLVSMGTINNGLMLIIAAQLFGLPEVLIAAMYSIPFFMLLLPYQRYADWRKI